MNTHQHQMTKDHVVVVEQGKQDYMVLAPAEKQKAPPPPSSSSSSSSSASSPSHEFSFTISLCSSSSSKSLSCNNIAKSQSTLAVDLSPADDIFFHGHLLPLHFLSHLPVSPRSSTNSPDSFTLPIKDLKQDPKPREVTTNNNDIHGNSTESRGGRSKQKSFSLFSLAKWRKGFEPKEKQKGKEMDQKKKMRLDVSRVLKKYARMFGPLLFFKRSEKGMWSRRRQGYCSYSGNLSSRFEEKRMRGFSAPVSMTTSPTNSGLLVATTSLSSNASASTMEELQAAIQAAIAHCKNSFAVEDKLK